MDLELELECGVQVRMEVSSSLGAENISFKMLAPMYLYKHSNGRTRPSPGGSAAENFKQDGIP